MSTIVATNGVEEVAGSAPSRRSTNGSIEPMVTPHKTTATSENPTTRLTTAPAALPAHAGEGRGEG